MASIALKSIMDAHNVKHWGGLYLSDRVCDKIEVREIKVYEMLQKRAPLEFEAPPDTRFLVYRQPTRTYERTIVSIGLPYGLSTGNHTIPGMIVPSAWDKDYHVVAREALESIHSSIEDALGIKGIEPEYCVDTSRYIDREIGLYTGLGKYGKNHMLLHPTFGSHFYIAYVIYPLRIDFQEDYSLFMNLEDTEHDFCHECNRCQKACPSKICGVFDAMDSQKCLSYLTQKKGALSHFEYEGMRNHIYGCDACQSICPSNRHAIFMEPHFMDCFEMLEISQREFKRRHKGQGFSWRSPWVYKRNALINLANTKDKSILSALKQMDVLQEHHGLRDVYRWIMTL